MSDGVKLFVRHYGTSTRTMLWCHGVGEHGGRNTHVMQPFLARGWQVILPDLRGHGRSEGLRCDVPCFDRYLEDFDQIVREFQLDPARTALLGHSMGGLIMTRYVETRTLNWAALVLSAPLLGVALPIPQWKWMLGRVLAVIAPRTHLRTDIREDNLTRDRHFLELRNSDPLIHRSVTVRWFFAMLAALKQAHRDAKQIRQPVLILQGMADHTTDPAVPERWLATTSSTDTRFIGYPSGLHEVFKDTGWQSICETVLDWLEPRIPAG